MDVRWPSGCVCASDPPDASRPASGRAGSVERGGARPAQRWLQLRIRSPGLRRAAPRGLGRPGLGRSLGPGRLGRRRRSTQLRPEKPLLPGPDAAGPDLPSSTHLQLEPRWPERGASIFRVSTNDTWCVFPFEAALRLEIAKFVHTAPFDHFCERSCHHHAPYAQVPWVIRPLLYPASIPLVPQRCVPGGLPCV